MAGTCYYSNVLGWYTIFLGEVFGYNQIVIRDNTFDGCNDKFVLYFCLQLLQMRFEVRRRRNKYQCMRCLDYIVDVRTEIDPLGIKLDACQIGRGYGPAA